jgi:ABC-type lipoprotein export system ATPase subunit
MSLPVFNIRQLSCAYDRKLENRILFIDQLEIHRGELVFLLGSSGSGKSTLLETLGLMNNTIAGGSIAFTPTDNDGTLDIATLWNSENASKAADIRKSNYSFIFQNTNLMENFTAYENICLSKMIQQGAPQNEAMQNAKLLMNQVGLPENVVSTDVLSVNLSGGQRQRIAFVRALNSECKVLFGDEPTGNLDENNANELMQVVREHVNNDITAVFVSHDINLALNHADRIICLTRNLEKGYGEILKENIYERKQWENYSKDELHVLREKIKSFYLNPTPQTKKSEPLSSKSKSYTQKFTSLFLSKEGKALSGNRFTNFIILSALLFLTFLAIGFANGCIDYLEKKLNNPFVNWLTITIPWAKDDQMNDVKRKLNNPEIKRAYNINSVTSYTRSPIFILSKKENSFFPTNARSIEIRADYRDPILGDLVTDKNLIKGTTEGFRERDLSLIVTERLMTDFGYDIEKDHHVLLESIVVDTSGNVERDTIPIGIRAVVKELPGKAQAVYTLYFHRAQMQNNESTFDRRLKKSIVFYVANQDEKYASKFRKSIQKIIDRLEGYDAYLPDVYSPTVTKESYLQAYEVRVAFDNNPEDYKIIDRLYGDIVNDKDFAEYKNVVSRTYDYYKFDEKFQETVSNDELSVNFTTIDKVREFATYLFKTFNDDDEKHSGGLLEVDISKVKEKENFLFLSNITKSISLILIFFGTISVSLFVFNLLKTHLEKVKMNIGTFKAFGLGDNKAQGIYFVIIVRFLLLSIAAALFFAQVFGYFLEKLLHSRVKVEEGVTFFKLFDNGSLVTIVTTSTIALILVTALVVSWFTIRNILSKTPGDLIYNR